jgi:RNA polymerase sigma-70 factor (ECF subfamily)
VPADHAREERVYLELVRELQGSILNYLYRMVGDSDTAEDLTQETFLRAFRALDRLEMEDDAAARRRAWLYRIAHNVALDHLRRGARLQWLPLGPFHRAPRSDPASRSDARDPVQRALARLGAAERELLLLFSQEQLTTEEVASVLDITVAAARKRRQRARSAFMAAYEDETRDV